MNACAQQKADKEKKKIYFTVQNINSITLNKLVAISAGLTDCRSSENGEMTSDAVRTENVRTMRENNAIYYTMLRCRA